jgi:RNA recognition motif-containing protein
MYRIENCIEYKMFANLKSTLRAQQSSNEESKKKKKNVKFSEKKKKHVEKKGKKKTTVESTSDRSFHVTSLPYEATKRQISAFFVDNGCDVVSCRMVMKQGSFNGVAFLDVLDEKSALAALRIHQNVVFLGRKINVRPTVSKDDLKRIVASRGTHTRGRGGRGGGRGGRPSSRSNVGKKRPRRDEAPLTKRQRAKRAAIIAARGGRGRGRRGGKN